MKKRISIATIVTLCAMVSTSYADQVSSFPHDSTIQNANSSFSPYISIMFGRQTFSDKQETNWSGAVNGSTRYPFGNDGFSTSFGLGIRKNFLERWGIGAEIFVNGTNITDQQTSSASSAAGNYTFNTTLKNTWGIQITPGYYLTHSAFLYVPIGWVRSQFNLYTDAVNNVPSINKNLNGLRLGLGMEQAVNDNLHLRLEYVNTQYQNFNSNFNNGTQQKDRRYSLSTNQFNLGLSYYLDAIKPKYQKTLKLLDGWYVGGAVGQSAQTTKLNINESTTALSQQQTLYGSDAVGKFMFGYGYNLPQRFYLGAEAEGLLESNNNETSASFSDYPLTREAQMRDSFILSAVPGYQVSSDFRLYGKIGFAEGRYTYDLAQNDMQVNDSKNLSGLAWGLGGELALNNNWALRAEYQEIAYQSLNTQVLTTSETVKPTMHYYTLGAVYHFD